MSRDLRRVPPNWKHPFYENEYRGLEMQPMHDEHFDDAFSEWLAEFDRIRAGNLTEDEAAAYPRGLADWLQDDGRPPDPRFYRPWRDDEATWYQIWETVSEGTPVTPPFETANELIDYLAENGDQWDQNRGDPPWPRRAAEKLVNGGGGVPSFVVMDGDVVRGIDVLDDD